MAVGLNSWTDTVLGCMLTVSHTMVRSSISLSGSIHQPTGLISTHTTPGIRKQSNENVGGHYVWWSLYLVVIIFGGTDRNSFLKS